MANKLFFSFLRHHRFFSSSSSTVISDLTSIAKPGYVLKGLNVFVGESDPVIKEPSEYPDWMLKILSEPKQRDLIGKECESQDPQERQEFFKKQQRAIRKEKMWQKNNELRGRK